MKYIVLIIVFACMAMNNITFASTNKDLISKKIFRAWQLQAKQRRNTTSYGKVFLHRPYMTYPILPEDVKSIKYNLNGMDCYTFVESTIVGQLLGLSYKDYRDYNLNYKSTVNKIRFANDSYEYGDQLHYASDWLYHMQSLGLARDITKILGGVPYKKIINFISNHVDCYHLLVNNPRQVRKVKLRERKINLRKRYYIPTKNFHSIIKNLQEGDIILFTSTTLGLDVAHMGFVTIKHEIPYLFEASPIAEQVTIETLPIENYLNEHANLFSGVIVGRLKLNHLE